MIIASIIGYTARIITQTIQFGLVRFVIRLHDVRITPALWVFKSKKQEKEHYPANANDVRQKLKSDVLAQRFLGEGNKAVYEVLIDLQRDPGDSTCYDWSFGEPENVSMGIGTYCSVLTETRRRSMFQYLFEASRTRLRNMKLKLE